jgi:BirA family transcriptional regulator, biotin operon repressor / biotin---[acetyl-CoA-carboxylase] ligase
MTDFKIQFVAQTDSTNTQLVQRAARRSMHRSVLVADVQTAGRGQRGRRWQASAGEAVLMSVAWEFERTKRLDGLSLAVGVAVSRALAAQLGNRAKLKWPNDLVIDESHKLGGILIETVLGPFSTRTAVIGIGLNLRTPRMMPVVGALPSIGLDEVAGVRHSRDDVVALLLRSLNDALMQFTTSGFAAFRDKWLASYAYADKVIVARFPDGEQISGRIIDVTAQGGLVIESEAGRHTLVSGEVTLRAFGS